MTLVGLLSAATGIPEAPLRLLVTILLGYPAAAIYSLLFLQNGLRKDVSATLRNVYNLLVGAGLAYFYCGTDIIHGIATILGTYSLLWLAQASGLRKTLLGPAVLIFNLTYLLVGYIYTATDGYDINWTMAQCILCLRLIGLGWDVSDGTDGPVKDISGRAPISFPDDAPLPDIPPLLRVAGWCFNPTSFLVGPQFSYRLYERSLYDANFPEGKVPAGRGKAVATSFAIGVFYLGINEILGGFFSTGFLATEEFLTYGYLHRFIYMWIACKGAMCKYLGIWKITEGACIVSGIGFGGGGVHGVAPRWDGLTNIDIWGYESATSLSQIITSFNINTNHWVKRYIFKRLRFLGSKELSSLGALFFLAIWHGFHLNYFITFGMEFLDMEAERRGRRILSPLTARAFGKDGSAPLRGAFKVLWWSLTSSALYYAVAAFDNVDVTKAWASWRSIGFLGWWAVVAIFLADTLLLSLRPRPARGTKPSKSSKSE